MNTDLVSQWLATVLTLRPELRFDRRGQGESAHIVIEDPVRSKFFQIGISEFELALALDGRRSLQEILEHFEGKSTYNRNSIVRIGQWFAANNLAYIADMDSMTRIEQQAQVARRAKLSGMFNPISCKVSLFNPNDLLSGLRPVGDFLFSKWVFCFWIGLGFYAFSILVEEWDRMGSATLQVFSGYQWITLLVAWILLKVVHEFGHGMACRKFGGEVPDAGVLFILFTPMAYVNVTSTWRLANRWERIQVTGAGIYVELLVSFIALIIWKRYPGQMGNLAFDIFLMASVNTVLFNANPLMRFDGYFILSDLIAIPNLYLKGQRWLGEKTRQLVFGSPAAESPPRSEEIPYIAIYGMLAWMWRLVVGIGLLIAASVLFHGAGIALALFGMIVWYALPLWKQWEWFRKSMKMQMIQPKRMAISASISAGLVMLIFFVLKAPATKGAPAIVQFAGEQVLRAGGEGFVKEIRVHNGQLVRENDVLIVLENRQLELEVFELQKLIDESRIQSRINKKSNEQSKAQAEDEKTAGLEKQLIEKQAQLDSLTVKAPNDGLVFERGLDTKQGAFMKLGDALLTFAHSSNKEVIVSVDQRDWESIKGNEGKFFRVAFPGCSIVSSRLENVNPRASTQLTQISLGAHLGGSLPVRQASAGKDAQDSTNEVELFAPRFDIELGLDETNSNRLVAGQRGWAFFEASRQSLGSYLYVSAREWLIQKIETAKQNTPF